MSKSRVVYFNNRIEAKQSMDSVARELLDAVLNAETVYLMVDDGDGDVWRHTLSCESERVEKDNDDQDGDEDDDSRSERRAEDNFDNYRRGGLD